MIFYDISTSNEFITFIDIKKKLKKNSNKNNNNNNNMN